MSYLNIARINKLLRQYEENHIENNGHTVDDVTDFMLELRHIFKEEVEEVKCPNKGTLQYYFDSFTKEELKSLFVGVIYPEKNIEKMFEYTESDIEFIFNTTFKMIFEHNTTHTLFKLVQERIGK